MSKKTGVTSEVATRVGGHQDLIWVTRYDDLAAYEKATAGLAADAEYHALIKAGRDKGLIQIGTAEAALWRTL